ncbi:hypothetical protein BD777DRAFT_161024 [Yarrowia lipolytica]|nr:hypothetical protein BD777DRAFT_161024 [Yarrowia lipolytica]
MSNVDELKPPRECTSQDNIGSSLSVATANLDDTPPFCHVINMLPWELLSRLGLDVQSLVSLSQTCRAWFYAISDQDWEQLLTKECPNPWMYYTYSPRASWRACAVAYVKGRRGKLPPRHFSKHTWPVYVDTPLPTDFYSLCKQTGTMQEEAPLVFCDNGFFSNSGFVNLSEDQESFYEPHIWYEDGILSNAHGIEMEIGPKRPCVIRSSPHALVVLFEHNIHTGLYVKFRDTPGRAPDVKLDKTVSFLYSSCTIYLFYNFVLIVKRESYGTKFYTVWHGVFTKITPPMDQVWRRDGVLLCWDGNIWATDSTVWGANVGFGTSVKVVQDEEFGQYAALYNQEGLCQRLIDLKNKFYMDVGDMHANTLITLIGVSYEEVGIYTFTKSYLANTIMGYQGDSDLFTI